MKQPAFRNVIELLEQRLLMSTAIAAVDATATVSSILAQTNASATQPESGDSGTVSDDAGNADPGDTRDAVNRLTAREFANQLIGAYTAHRDDQIASPCHITSSRRISISELNGMPTTVQGVGEVNVVESDTRYIYCTQGANLYIVDTQAESGPAVVGQLDLQDSALRLYLNGDRLTVISEYDQQSAINIDYTSTSVRTLDISDRSLPVVLTESSFSGSLSDSRMIGDQLYLSLHSNLPFLSRRSIDGVMESTEQFQQRIDGLQPTDIFPSYTTQMADGQHCEGTLFDGDVLVRDIDAEMRRFWDCPIASLVVLNTQSGAVALAPALYDADALMSVSQDSIYLTSEQFGAHGWIAGDGMGYTQIDKFSLTAAGPQWVFRGHVDTAAAFPVDERDGLLRVVSNGSWKGGRGVYVLKQEGQSLQIVGQLEGLSVEDPISSVQFVGNVAYAATYVHGDLIVIDFSNPTQPTLQIEAVAPVDPVDPSAPDPIVTNPTDLPTPTQPTLQGEAAVSVDPVDPSPEAPIATNPPEVTTPDQPRVQVQEPDVVPPFSNTLLNAAGADDDLLQSVGSNALA